MGAITECACGTDMIDAEELANKIVGHSSYAASERKKCENGYNKPFLDARRNGLMGPPRHVQVLRPPIL